MNDEKVFLGLPKELKEKAKGLAKRKSISLNALIRIALCEYVERNE